MLWKLIHLVWWKLIHLVQTEHLKSCFAWLLALTRDGEPKYATILHAVTAQFIGRPRVRHMKSTTWRNCTKMLVVLQFAFLFRLVRAEYLTTRFHIMKANATSSPPIKSYRTEFARSAVNCVALCPVDPQCSGVGVEPIGTRKVRCYFVSSCVIPTQLIMKDIWQKVRKIFFILRFHIA